MGLDRRGLIEEDAYIELLRIVRNVLSFPDKCEWNCILENYALPFCDFSGFMIFVTYSGYISVNFM